MMHTLQYKDTSEAAVAGAKSIFMSCVRSGTVKRLIYTASVVSASPLKEDGSDFKDVMDETCWTPLNDSLEYVYLEDPAYKVSCQLLFFNLFQRKNSGSCCSCSHLHILLSGL